MFGPVSGELQQNYKCQNIVLLKQYAFTIGMGASTYCIGKHLKLVFWLLLIRIP
jgi:hypothetical protein